MKHCHYIHAYMYVWTLMYRWARGSRLIVYDSSGGLNTYVRMESGEILWNQQIELP